MHDGNILETTPFGGVHRSGESLSTERFGRSVMEHHGPNQVHDGAFEPLRHPIFVERYAEQFFDAEFRGVRDAPEIKHTCNLRHYQNARSICAFLCASLRYPDRF